MRYCKKCVLPDTRPGLNLNEDGICAACIGHQKKKTVIDWKAREKSFRHIVKEAKAKNASYDCIIPVSGGKDSTWQVVQCLKYGLHVLAVTWKTPGRTKIGQANLDNLISLGVDHIDFTINPEVERKFTYQTLEKTGSTGVPMHMAVYSIPLRLAVQWDAPLVIWGENPHMEYGGSDKERNVDQLDHNWLKTHGILQGTSADDWIGKGGLTREEMSPYYMPTQEEFRRKTIRSIFLGFYFKWDPQMTLRSAAAHGFQVRKEGPKTGYYNYADIDCDFISVHHHFKWLKFGFTRLFDNLSIEIREGRLTRAQAVNVIRKMGDQRPVEDIDRLCRFLKIPLSEFKRIEEKFRNTKIWKKEKGKWVLPEFLVEDWKWR